MSVAEYSNIVQSPESLCVHRIQKQTVVLSFSIFFFTLLTTSLSRYRRRLIYSQAAAAAAVTTTRTAESVENVFTYDMPVNYIRIYIRTYAN